MNILADIQQRSMEAGLSEEETARRRAEFLETYYKLRRKSENSLLGRMPLRTRKCLHPLVLLIYTVKNRLGGFRYAVIADKREKVLRPIIFAITHVGKFDIEVVSEAIKDHYYLLSGDYEHIQGIVDEPFLSINGVIYFNETVREDRRAVSQRMISLLQDGGNLMYFPEGTWNLTPNLPVLPCYWGIVEIAQKGNAIIVPIAAEQYGKHFEFNVGKHFDMLDYGVSREEKSRAISDLRDTLAALKWEIWERHQENRENILPDEWDKYLNARFREWTYFSLDYVDTLIFRPKGITTYEEAFAHLDDLIPCKENAFLLRKRNGEMI